MAGVEVIITTKTGNQGVVVAPALTYSVLFQAKASVASLEAQANIRWYKSDGSASAITPISSGTYTALSTSAWTAILLNAATSPADAAYAAVEIRWRHTTTTAVGQFINVDNVVLSRSNQAAWGPGGASTNIKFVIERSGDGGFSWEAVWGQNYDNPVPARSQSDTRVIIRDRAVQLNNSFLRYRCYAIGYDANNLPVYSLPTVTASGAVPPVLSDTSFLRYPDNQFYDGRFHVESFSRSFALGGEAYAPQGSDYGIVQYDTAPQVETIDFTVWCIDGAPLSRLINLLMMKKTIFTQLSTAVRYIRPVGDATIVPIRAAPTLTEVAAVRVVNKVSFKAVTLQPPTFVSRLVTV